MPLKIIESVSGLKRLLKNTMKYKINAVFRVLFAFRLVLVDA